MKIYIPSYKRGKRIGVDGTLQWFPADVLRDVYVVVRREESAIYANALSAYLLGAEEGGLKILTGDFSGIADTRKHIGEHAAAMGYDRFCMMDDDLMLAVRKSEHTTSLRPQIYDDTREMLAAMSDYLDRYAHVAISLRQGNNNSGAGPSPLLALCGRGIRCVAYRTKEFNSVEHCRVQVMEDIDVTLQLLRRGLPNAIFFYWCQDHKQTNASGGCSEWRTHEVHEAAAREIHRLHLDFTKLRQKENKSGGEFGTRTEITAFWKKAFESAP